MKTLLKALFGEVGLLISAALMTAASWFLFPMFMKIVQGGHSLANILGYVFICPFVFGFYISAVITSLGLVGHGIRDKRWLWSVLGLIVLAADIVILVLNIT